MSLRRRTGAAALRWMGQIDVWRAGWIIAGTWWIVNALFTLWLRFAYPDTAQTLFVDGRLYRLASLAWLEGRDPWGNLGLFPYAAPPPTLLFTAPLALVPESVAIPVLVALCVMAAAYAIRRLRLPWILMLWPPLLNAIVVANPNALLVALLISPLAPLAVLAKVYAIFPLIGRWRAMTTSLLLLLVTAPFLPWATYVADFGAINAAQSEHALSLSAWNTPLLLAVIPALLVLGRAGAWLAVPAAWPLTQDTYGAIALPVMRNPYLAMAFSLPVPLLIPISVVALAIWRTVRRRPAKTVQEDGRFSEAGAG
jgi:hypothetical protein